jgi:hypothetical protein
MSRSPPIVRKRDLANVLGAVRAAGERVSRVEIGADGKITVITVPDAEAINTENPEEALLKAIHGRSKKAAAL